MLAAVTPPALRALTFNVAGIPFVHPRARLRLKAVAARLKDAAYDIVALQEVWIGPLGRSLARDAAMPHHARAAGGLILGSGLVTLSRHPILLKEEHLFRARPRKIKWDGEAVVDKGILMTRVETGAGILDVYNFHLTSFYGHGEYADIRERQILELCGFAGKLSSGRPAVFLGDLNLGAEEPAYRRLLENLRLFDPCMDAGQDVCGPTFQGRRIDYILLPAGAKARTRPAFAEKLRDGAHELAYSDHLAVEADFGPEIPALEPSRFPIAGRAF